MQNVIVSVSYDTSRNSRDFRSYSVSFAGSDDPVTGSLRQSGEVFNNVVRYGGVFASKADATRAVLGYINTPCSMLAITDALSGDTAIRLVSLSEQLTPRDGIKVRLLGRRTSNGTYVTDKLS